MNISKMLGFSVALVATAIGVYNLGYANGRYDLIREPTRKEYVYMGWNWDEAEQSSDPGCAPHLDGNGSHCGKKCRPNCYVTNIFRGFKLEDKQ